MESVASLLVFRSPSHFRIIEDTDFPISSPFMLGRAQPTARSTYPPASLLLSSASD